MFQMWIIDIGHSPAVQCRAPSFDRSGPDEVGIEVASNEIPA